mmetsp:Transcript_3110/g.7240  ORF Transcript_3110/g.7240 Transcript_3110/m.7240 type:complete len:232 (+) Transcript_3110:3-698(+)
MSMRMVKYDTKTSRRERCVSKNSGKFMVKAISQPCATLLVRAAVSGSLLLLDRHAGGSRRGPHSLTSASCNLCVKLGRFSVEPTGVAEAVETKVGGLVHVHLPLEYCLCHRLIDLQGPLGVPGLGAGLGELRIDPRLRREVQPLRAVLEELNRRLEGLRFGQGLHEDGQGGGRRLKAVSHEPRENVENLRRLHRPHAAACQDNVEDDRVRSYAAAKHLFKDPDGSADATPV